ncbi:MAG: ribonuclease III [Roseburia sp.]|nr:ribonuclease III [Roseburia sp.]
MVKSRADMLTPVGLAFIGDAAYTLFIRRRIAESCDIVAGTLHTACAAHVNAKAQARVYDELVRRGALTAAEAEVAHRARNCHLHMRTKAASSADYRKATELEAVIGYVELTDDGARKRELLELCAEISGIGERGADGNV